jgi:hypothetical protein
MRHVCDAKSFEEATPDSVMSEDATFEGATSRNDSRNDATRQ